MPPSESAGRGSAPGWSWRGVATHTCLLSQDPWESSAARAMERGRLPGSQGPAPPGSLPGLSPPHLPGSASLRLVLPRDALSSHLTPLPLGPTRALLHGPGEKRGDPEGWGPKHQGSSLMENPGSLRPPGCGPPAGPLPPPRGGPGPTPSPLLGTPSHSRLLCPWLPIFSTSV